MKPEVKDLISSLRAVKQGINANQVQLLLDHIEELEEQQKLWLEPTAEMAQAGLAEVQNMLDEWSESFITIPEDVTDEMASDMAVFILQAMAGAK